MAYLDYWGIWQWREDVWRGKTCIFIRCPTHSWNSAMDRLSAVLCLVAQVCLILCDAMDCSPPGSSVHGDSPGKNWSGLPWPPSGDLPNPGVEPRSPTLSADSLLTEPAGKLKKLEWVAIPSPGVIPDPGIKLESPALQADSLPADLPRKPGWIIPPKIHLGKYKTQSQGHHSDNQHRMEKEVTTGWSNPRRLPGGGSIWS